MNLPVLGKVTLGGVAVGIVVGIVFAPYVRRIPGINKLPTA